MKKYFSYLGVLVLAGFSFFYTDKAVSIIRRNDPIMKELISNSETLKVSAIEPVFDGDNQTTGLNGKSINIDKSYTNMKKVNKYMESLIVFDEIFPQEKLDYSKYIIKGNSLKNQVSLVFKIDSNTYFKDLINILDKKEIEATLFIDGNVIENNMDYISKSVKKYEIENYGYNGIYDDVKLKWTNNMIESLTDSKVNYCYSEFKDNDIIDICSKNKLFTIKPSIITSNYPFLTVKKELDSGSIISFNLNNNTLKELPSIITYIKQKGFNIVYLKTLLSESIINEK